jgi:hypothetical protein
MKTYTEQEMNQVNILCQGIVRDNTKSIICLGQSSASKGVRFTLYTYTASQNIYGFGNPMKFNCVLTEDLLTSAQKARRICGRNDIELWDTDNNESTSIKLQCQRFIEVRPDMEEVLKFDHYIVENINAFFISKGYISEAQCALVKKIVREETIKRAELAEQRATQDALKHLEGHHYQEGSRVELELTEQIARFGWDTEYGYMQVIKYMTSDGVIVQYQGCSALLQEDGQAVLGKVKGTVKHVQFKGDNQTKIQRMSIVK